jgi:hypothetical protein
LDATSFDSLLDSQNPFGYPGGSFDLRSVGFISPSGMTLLAAACLSLHQLGRTPTIQLAGQDVPSYLVRAGFEGTVRSFAKFNPPFRKSMLGVYDHRHGRNPKVIELTQFRKAGDLPPLLDRLVAVLRGPLGFAREAAFDVGVAVSEACQNAVQHNEDGCGFVAMQTYSSQQGQFLEVGVSDAGDGLKVSLSRNPKTPKLISDHHSISYATELGTSEYDDPIRGRGLFHLLEAAYKYSGSVKIRSGTAAVRYRMDLRVGHYLVVPPMPGVHISLSVPAQSLG